MGFALPATSQGHTRKRGFKLQINYKIFNEYNYVQTFPSL